MAKHRSRHETPPEHQGPPDDATMMRIMNNYVGYWIVCGARACERKRGCAGDAIACFERFWPFTPERIKVEFRASIKALNEGVTSVAELARIVDAEVERAAEHIARMDAESARAWEAKVAAEKAQQAPRARIPSPLEGEGGRSERSEDRPGEGFSSLSKETPHPPRSARHPLPQGEREEERKGPRVRAL